MRIYISADHPGGHSGAATYGQDLARPFGICMLPVMVFALVAMLTGRSPLIYLYAGFPAAAAMAIWWTRNQMKSRIAAVEVGESHAGVLSRFDAAAGRASEVSQAVLDLKRTPGGAEVTIGLSSYSLSRNRWPDFDRLLGDLDRARDLHVSSVQGRLNR